MSCSTLADRQRLSLERGLRENRETELRELLHERISQRAYFFGLNSNVKSCPESHWRIAEKIEIEKFQQELRELAYSLWVDECRRIGGEVHCNDWYHWFSAEMQMLQNLRSRSLLNRVGEEMPHKTKDRILGGRTAGNTAGAPADTDVQNSRSSDAQVTPEACLIEGIQNQWNGKNMDKDDGTNVGRMALSSPDSVVKLHVDVSAPEYFNKFIVTDGEQTEVLMLADTLEDIDAALETGELQKKLQRFGSHAEFLIHQSAARSPEKVR